MIFSYSYKFTLMKKLEMMLRDERKLKEEGIDTGRKK
jgi:hypothetical protein